MRFSVMFVTAVCVLFLIKLRWPKKKNFDVNNLSLSCKLVPVHYREYDYAPDDLFLPLLTKERKPKIAPSMN